MIKLQNGERDPNFVLPMANRKCKHPSHITMVEMLPIRWKETGGRDDNLVFFYRIWFDK